MGGIAEPIIFTKFPLDMELDNPGLLFELGKATVLDSFPIPPVGASFPFSRSPK